MRRGKAGTVTLPSRSVDDRLSLLSRLGGMLTLQLPEPVRGGGRIRSAHVDDDWITIILADGRQLRLPTVFSTPLFLAGERERRDWRVSGSGRSVRWRSLGVVLGIRRRPRTPS